MGKRKNVHQPPFWEESLINLTPLIDVIFVVLVAFILIAPLLEVDNIDLASSSRNLSAGVLHKGAINIYVREDDSIWLNNKAVTTKELIDQLKDKRKLYPYQSPYLFHHKQACFGTYQQVKNCVKQAGFPQLEVILKSN